MPTLSLPMRLVLPIVLLSVAGPAWAATWMTNETAARNVAKRVGQPLLIYFTQSDDCEPCRELEAQVFDTEAFEEWARDRVQLLKLDASGEGEVAARAKTLAKKHEVEKYPTLVFVGPDQKVIGTLGAVEGGVEAWTAQAQAVLGEAGAKQPERQGMTDAARGEHQLAMIGQALAQHAAEHQPPPELLERLRQEEAERGEGPLEVHKDFEAAHEKALADKRPLFLIVTTKGDTLHASLVEELLEAPEFRRYGRGNVVVAHVEKARDAQDEDHPAYRAFLKQYEGELQDAPFLYALVDLAEKKVLLNMAELTPAPAVVRRMKTLFPEPRWLEDFEQAKEMAAETGRPMLLAFTGSDEDGKPKKLDEEVFTTDVFKRFAAANLVLVKLDLASEDPPSDEGKPQHQALQERFNVRSDPAVVILSAQGEEIGRISDLSGGPEPFLARLRTNLGQEEAKQDPQEKEGQEGQTR